MLGQTVVFLNDIYIYIYLYETNFSKMASNSDGRKVALITGITGQDGSYLAGRHYIKPRDISTRAEDPVHFPTNPDSAHRKNSYGSRDGSKL